MLLRDVERGQPFVRRRAARPRNRSASSSSACRPERDAVDPGRGQLGEARRLDRRGIGLERDLDARREAPQPLRLAEQRRDQRRRHQRGRAAAEEDRVQRLAAAPAPPRARMSASSAVLPRAWSTASRTWLLKSQYGHFAGRTASGCRARGPPRLSVGLSTACQEWPAWGRVESLRRCWRRSSLCGAAGGAAAQRGRATPVNASRARCSPSTIASATRPACRACAWSGKLAARGAGAGPKRSRAKAGCATRASGESGGAGENLWMGSAGLLRPGSDDRRLRRRAAATSATARFPHVSTHRAAGRTSAITPRSCGATRSEVGCAVARGDAATISWCAATGPPGNWMGQAAPTRRTGPPPAWRTHRRGG